MGWGVKGPILALALTSLLPGSVLLFLSIHSKNATLASLIEITYRCSWRWYPGCCFITCISISPPSPAPC